MTTLVMKFGGAAMADAQQFSKLAEVIESRVKNFLNVVVVVSAMGSSTDALMQLSKTVHSNPPKRELDMLVSVGERISMALLAMALDLRGIDAVSFTGSQSGIITTNEHAQAKILEVRPQRVEQALNEGKVAIIAGFQGVSKEKEITTLGRGGSDTSAVALAVALDAERVEFYKDVPGIGEGDPKTNPHTKIFPRLSYTEALSITKKEAGVLHQQCLELAREKGLELQVRSFLDPETVGTTISSRSFFPEGNAVLS